MSFKKKTKTGIDMNTPGEKVFDVFNVILMLVLIFVTLYPLYYVVMASVSDPRFLLAHEGPLVW